MSRHLYNSFKNVSYPCFILTQDGEFWCNQNAQQQTNIAIELVKGMLQMLLREMGDNIQNNKKSTPMLTDALRVQGLTVITLAEGLLAFAAQPLESPSSIFSAQLREPLTNVFSVLPLLSKKLEDEDLRYTEEIQLNCYQLLRLACNIENAGRIEKRNFDLHTLDLRELVKSVCFSTESVCREKNIAIEWELPDVSVAVLCDPRLFSEALLNLLRNSMQYTRDGNNIHVRLLRNGKQALLTVEDRGLGIRPEHIEHIFKPYFSEDPYGDGGLRPGLGLGLAVAREAARSFGGNIMAESRFGEGTRISISLPLSDASCEVLGSDSADYLLNRYSSIYVQLCGLCRMPGM